MDQTANKVYFSNCQFVNNYGTENLIYFWVENYYNREFHVNVYIVLHGCVFSNNKHASLISALCYAVNERYCISVIISNTTISSNIQNYDDLIFALCAMLTFENVIITNNTVLGIRFDEDNVIIKIDYGYIQYNQYNEISKNSANYIIYMKFLSEQSVIYVNENSILNISMNILKSLYIIIIVFREDIEFENVLFNILVNEVI